MWVHHIASHWPDAALDETDRALCGFAAQLTQNPQAMSNDHILELKHHGLDDAAIHDASQVISYFNYINRIADSLNVDLEEDIHAWESGVPSHSG